MLYLVCENVSIIGYTNSDYACCSDVRNTISRYIFQFIGGVISWRSCHQECTALSTTKAKYVVASEARKEAVAFLISL